MPRMTSARACSIMQWVLCRPRTLHRPQARGRRLQRTTCLQCLCRRPNLCWPALRQRQRRCRRRWPMMCRRPPTIHRRQHTRRPRWSLVQPLQPRATQRRLCARLRGARAAPWHRLAASAPPGQCAALDLRLPFERARASEPATPPSCPRAGDRSRGLYAPAHTHSSPACAGSTRLCAAVAGPTGSMRS